MEDTVCYRCGRPMSKDEGTVHKHGTLPKHGHCSTCIVENRKRWIERGITQPEHEFDYYLHFGYILEETPSDQYLRRAFEDLTTNEGYTLSIKDRIYLDDGSWLDPECHECDKPIMHSPIVVLQKGGHTVYLHKRCFTNDVMDRARLLRYKETARLIDGMRKDS